MARGSWQMATARQIDALMLVASPINGVCEMPERSALRRTTPEMVPPDLRILILRRIEAPLWDGLKNETNPISFHTRNLVFKHILCPTEFFNVSIFYLSIGCDHSIGCTRTVRDLQRSLTAANDIINTVTDQRNAALTLIGDMAIEADRIGEAIQDGETDEAFDLSEEVSARLRMEVTLNLPGGGWNG